MSYEIRRIYPAHKRKKKQVKRKIVKIDVNNYNLTPLPNEIFEKLVKKSTITEEKSKGEYWNEMSEKKSKSLWIPTKDNTKEFDLVCLKQFEKAIENKSIFKNIKTINKLPKNSKHIDCSFYNI